MTIEVLEKIREEKRKQAATLVAEIEEIDATLQTLEKYKDAVPNLLATVKGICPFPDSCNSRHTCTLDRCNADTCSNGHAYHFS